MNGEEITVRKKSASDVAALAFNEATGAADLDVEVNNAYLFGLSGENTIKLTSAGFPAVEGTITAPEYEYVYAGLRWDEYWAAEGVYNASDVSSNETKDSNKETDLGGFDAVTRATVNHGLHRGSYQSIAVITGTSGKTYKLLYWTGDGETTAVFADGTTAVYDNKTEKNVGKLTFEDGTTDTVKSYQVLGLKYVPVQVKRSDYAAFTKNYTVVKSGEALKGGYSEKNLNSYSETAAVDANTNGLKTAVNDGNGNFSFGARKTGTGSGIQDKSLNTASDITVTVKPATGEFGEFLRVDLTGSGYGSLGASMQAVKWTYYGNGSTPLATYGTKFAADNWMHSKNGIQLGLSRSARCQLPEGTDGTGKWEITIYALGYNDYTFSVDVTSDNIVAEGTALSAKVAEAKAVNEADYLSTGWSDFTAALADCETMLSDVNAGPVALTEVNTKISTLNNAMAKLVKKSISLSAETVKLYTKGSTTTTLNVTTNMAGTATWSSSNSKVATVDGNGKVTAKAAGTAVITATLGGKSASCTVTVKVPSITAKAAASTIYTKGKKTTTIKVTKDGVSGTAKYTSSNKKIATVSKSGKVTAKKAGTVKITVKVGTYKKTVTIKVKKPSLKLTKSSVTLKKGKSTTIKAKATPTGKITYKSSNKSVATVTKKGVVKAKKKGTATITVTCNGVKKTFKVKVK